MSRNAPKFFGQDKEAAIKEAKAAGTLIVVYSLAPGASHQDKEPQFGYWTDTEGGMVRSWEQQVYPD